MALPSAVQAEDHSAYIYYYPPVSNQRYLLLERNSVQNLAEFVLRVYEKRETSIVHDMV